MRKVAPSMPDTKVQSLIRAANNEQFDKQEGVNEKFLLDKELASIASHISAQLGPFALDVYEQAQKVISAGVLRIINEGDRTGSFRGQNARGGSQWDIQQLTAETFGGTTSDRTYSTGTTGTFDIAPNFGGASTQTTASLNAETQYVFILGFYSSMNPRIVEQAKVDVDDGEERTAFDVYGHMNLGTLQAFDTPSVEYVTDDDAYDIDGTAVQNAETDAFPFGVNIDTAANLPGPNTGA